MGATRMGRIAGLFAWCVASCAGPQPTDSSPCEQNPGAFDHPQAVVVTEALVVVSNTAFEPDSLTFGKGFITVIDRETDMALHTAPVSHPNPQFAVRTEDDVLVVCSGLTRFDQDSGVNIAEGPGALDRFPIATLAQATGPSDTIPIPVDPNDTRIGGPGSIAITGDKHFAFLASGLSARVFKIDLEQWTLVRSAEDPITIREHEKNDTITLAWHPGGWVLAASFNSNHLFRIDPDTDEVFAEHIDLGMTSDLEGPLDLLVLPERSPDVFALMGIGNAVATWDSATGQQGVSAAVFPAGPIANRLAHHGDFVYVVNSGANNLQRVALGSYEVTHAFSAFPVGASPWEMAVDPVTGEGYVTLNICNSVAVVDLTTGELREEVR